MRISEAVLKRAERDIRAYLRGDPARVGQVHLYGVGPVARLEEKLKRHYSMPFALAASNATTALMVVGLALGLKQREIVTTPYTYGATLAGMLHLGCTPVFADIDAMSLCMDPFSVEKRISARTAAVLAVDIFGNPADMFGLRKIADEHGIWYIADAAQSFGAIIHGLPASSLADVLVVSFTCGKTLFAGEGAAILCRNREVFERLLWHSQHPNRQRLELGLGYSNELGLNARIHPLAAIWANDAFEASLESLAKYQRHCFALIHALNDTGLAEPILFEEREILPAFFRLTAALRAESSVAILEGRLAKQGFRIKVGGAPLQPLYRQPAFVSLTGGGDKRTLHRCLVTEKQARRRFLIDELSSLLVRHPHNKRT